MKSKLRTSPFRSRQSTLAAAVLAQFPDDAQSMIYLEPFATGISVLLNKPKADHETVNDLDAGAVRILRVLRDTPKEFTQKLRRTKCTEETYLRALSRGQPADEFDGATTEFILRRMGRPGIARFRHDPGWEAAVRALPQIAERLRDVNVFSKPAGYVLSAYNEKNALCYCCLTGGEPVPDKLLTFRGKVVVTGDPDMYQKQFSEWTRVRSAGLSVGMWKNY